MKKNFIKPNNYAKAFATLEAIDKEATSKIAQEIPERDKGLYVALLVQRVNNELEHKYETRINTQKFNQQAFEKISKNYKEQGYEYVIVLHTPDRAVTSAEDAQNAADSTKNQTESVKSLAQQLNDAKAKLLAEYNAKWPGEPEPQFVVTHDRLSVVGLDRKEISTHIDTPEQIEAVDPLNDDLSSYKADDLRTFVAKYGIDVQGETTKEKILPIAQEWQKANQPKK